MLFQVEGSACSKVLGWKGQGWLEEPKEGFAGGSVVKNPPANTGDAGSVPDLGRSYVPRSTHAHATHLLAPCSGAWELQPLKPEHSRSCAAQQEKPARRGAQAPQLVKTQDSQNKYNYSKKRRRTERK